MDAKKFSRGVARIKENKDIFKPYVDLYTSAKSGKNVEEIFNLLAKSLV
mgnify:CR=1 FL=1